MHSTSGACSELVLAVALLGANALGTLKPHCKSAQGIRAVGLVRRRAACGHRGLIGTQLALHFAHHDAQNGSLALDSLAQALQLLRMTLAAGLAAKGLAFLGEGLLAGNAGSPSSADHLVTGELQQAAVHRVGDGLGWHGAVDDDALEIGGAHSLDQHRVFDSDLKQLLQAVLAEQAPEAADLRGVARQARLLVVHAAEELPLHGLGPAFDEFFVAEVETVL